MTTAGLSTKVKETENSIHKRNNLATKAAHNTKAIEIPDTANFLTKVLDGIKFDARLQISLLIGEWDKNVILVWTLVHQGMLIIQKKIS